jgi:hypothetical protein
MQLTTWYSRDQCVAESLQQQHPHQQRRQRRQHQHADSDTEQDTRSDSQMSHSDVLAQARGSSGGLFPVRVPPMAPNSAASMDDEDVVDDPESESVSDPAPTRNDRPPPDARADAARWAADSGDSSIAAFCADTTRACFIVAMAESNTLAAPSGTDMDMRSANVSSANASPTMSCCTRVRDVALMVPASQLDACRMFDAHADTSFADHDRQPASAYRNASSTNKEGARSSERQTERRHSCTRPRTLPALTRPQRWTTASQGGATTVSEKHTPRNAEQINLKPRP